MSEDSIRDITVQDHLDADHEDASEPGNNSGGDVSSGFNDGPAGEDFTDGTLW